MPQEDHGTCELNHAEEILWVILPANNDATIIMEPSKQTFNFPATTVAAQGATVLAVCDCHDFAAFAAFCRADTRAPFFAELKLASMKDSLRSSFPRSRKSSASFCSNRVSSPERCHCWKRR